MTKRPRFSSDQRGSALAVTAVSVGAVMCMLSLGIDLGMLFTARAEAQRAADSAALAGASAFLNPQTFTVGFAEDRAYQYATANNVRNVPIDSSEVTVVVDLSEASVTVRVERLAIPLWFARLLGIPSAPVAAVATAAANRAGGARCLAPVAVPDLWYNAADNNQIWEEGESWNFDPSRGDYFRRFLDPQGGPEPPETGFGSPFRNNSGDGITDDFGRMMAIKPQRPNEAPTAGFFYPVRLGDNTGGADYRRSWSECEQDNQATLGQPIDLEMGNMVGPTRQGVNAVVSLDPNAYWDAQAGRVMGSTYGDAWLSSPRVVLIMLFDPGQIAGITGGNLVITPHDFGLFFVETMGNGNNAPVYGRFLYYAQGDGTPVGDAAGSLARVLQLVK